MDKVQKGKLGEAIARGHLEEEGFKVIECGFRCRQGEVDLIATRKGELYFVEVKTRWSDNYGNPLESITAWKQRRLITAARVYLSKHRVKDAVCHLSAIGVDMSLEVPSVEFIEDAFELV